MVENLIIPVGFVAGSRTALTSGMAKRKVTRTIKPTVPFKAKLHIIALGTDLAASLTSSERWAAESDTGKLVYEVSK